MPWRGVRILSHDQDLYLTQRAAERSQHVLAGGQVLAASGQLGPQEGSHGGDRCGNGLQRICPVWADQLTQRTWIHAYPPSVARPYTARPQTTQLRAPGASATTVQPPGASAPHRPRRRPDTTTYPPANPRPAVR